MRARVAAFFDLDGTLLPLPSLEQRFLRVLRYRREIPLTNHFLWCREVLRLIPRGIGAVLHGNKMYLRGAHSFAESGADYQIDFCARKSGHPSQLRASEEEGQASAPPRHNPRCPVPHFFEDGVERVAWHALQGHSIVIVSGTLEPLASAAARALEIKLMARGIAAGVRVCATRLEENDGRWTGRILGEAMFGKAKARAIVRLAEEMSLDLLRSWTYGDSAQDRWMLAVARNPVAVNPSAHLARIAKERGFPVLRWSAEEHLTQNSKRTQSAQKSGSIRNGALRKEWALKDEERCS